MIHTHTNDVLRVALNEADGVFSLKELLKASVETKLLAQQGYGVIWDFRKLSVNDIDPKVLLTVGNTMRTMAIEALPQKRAILVRDTDDRDLLNTFLRKTTIGWPWSVFLEFDIALQWLSDSKHRQCRF